MVASEIPSYVPKDYTQFTKNATFHGLRLGVPRKVFFDVNIVGSQEIIDATDGAIRKMQSLGAFIQDSADLPSIEEFVETSYLEVLVLSIIRFLLLTKSNRVQI